MSLTFSHAVAERDTAEAFVAPEASAPRALRSATGMRIALFSGNYNCVRDGANRALNRLVAHLIAQGAQVRVYSPTIAEPAFAPAGDLVSVRSVPIPGRSEFRVALGLPAAIRADIRAFAPTLIHLSAPDLLGVAAQKFARELGVPVVASLHTRFETYFDYYGLGLLRGWGMRHLRRFYTGSDHVLAPNAACIDSVVEMGVPRARVGLWSRGVEAGAFSPALRDMAWRRSLGYADTDVVPLFFGRLVLEKGLDTFAQAIDELRARGRRVRPLVVGIGPAEKKMRAMLGDAVFTGHLDGLALGRAVASADLLLNPSLTEAFGNVNLEAMASGLAVVSADVGSAQALIESGRSGVLVPAQPMAMAEAADRLIAEPAWRARLGREAVQAAARFRWPEVLDAVVRAYEAMGARG